MDELFFTKIENSFMIIRELSGYDRVGNGYDRIGFGLFRFLFHF